MEAPAPEELLIDELAIPSAVGAAGFDEFAAATRLHFDAEAEAYGSREHDFTAEESLPLYLDQANQPTWIFVVRAGNQLAARARFEIEVGDAPQTAWAHVDVAPRFRRSGLGTRLSHFVEERARGLGITKIIAYIPSGPREGEQLPAPTGSGSLPLDNTEVRFLLGRGYRLEQVVRGSRLALPADVDAPLADAMAKATAYTIHDWRDHTPDRWHADMAMLRQRMSTEEPQGSLDEPEDVWTVERLLEHEARLDGSPRTTFTVAAEHTGSGRLVGFSTLSVPVELDRAISQEDTLVLPEHRGHSLGMLLKLANLAAVQKARPGHPSVLTFNAEENRHMLAVNEHLGFTPVGYEGAWRKDLHAT